MNNLITSKSASMTSLEIADLVGSRHDKVKQSIERLFSPQLDEAGNQKRPPVIVQPPMGDEKSFDALGRSRNTRVYIFHGEQGKRDSIIVVAQLSPEFTARLVDRWQELESAQVPSIPQTYAEALMEAGRLAQIAQEQADALKLAAPKVEFVDRYVVGTGLKGFRQVAKLIGANESRFREFMMDRKIMYRLGGEWMPYQNHLDAGRFSVKTGTADNGHVFNDAKFTPKGIEWVAGEWAKHQLTAQAEEVAEPAPGYAALAVIRGILAKGRARNGM